MSIFDAILLIILAGFVFLRFVFWADPRAGDAYKLQIVGKITLVYNIKLFDFFINIVYN